MVAAAIMIMDYEQNATLSLLLDQSSQNMVELYQFHIEHIYDVIN